jgi:ornithine carbamoyltransferase
MDLSPADVDRVMALGARVKEHPERARTALLGRSVALIFAKPSTRTRVSFEVAIAGVGAQPVVLTTSGGTGMQMGRGETVADTARVLSRYVDAIVIRTFAQSDVDELAEHGTIPVVNALTDMFHPCQALADRLTIDEHLQTSRGKKLVYVGAGNNVCHSLLLLGPRSGMDVVACCPVTRPPNAHVALRARSDAEKAGTKIGLETDVMTAVKNAHVVYTDTWVSMGEEKEADTLRQQLCGYSVTREVMGTAEPDAIFMHCLPAHRGDEVSADVMDGRWSVAFDQAENRLHVQKALLLLLLGAEPWS